ncbi:phospholipase A [Marinobacter sp.]|uniref:phospholipase A n=1 Tax=Marinobacter sp. TaxID=50741 RepID=UPI001A039796|nr:phospholipase A [Marinobacter sp.]MBE0486522.1 phospholipase A [Marinobacter sp.]
MKRYQPAAPGIVLALSLIAANVSASPRELSTENDGAINCALIQDGIQRLACYDAQTDPQAARASADEDSLEQAEQDADALVANGTAQEVVAEGDLDDAADSGVVAAMIDNYLVAEKAIFSFSGGFLTHRPNYILPLTYVDSPNAGPNSPRLGLAGYDYKLENEEAKYQISFKVPLLTGIFDNRTTLWFGYTQQSFWQVYNTKDSAPFRETNYEPEIFVRQRLNWDWGPGTLSAVSLGLNHQSNGQSEPRSRSWNRIMGTAAYSYDRWLFMVNPWYRLPESSGDDDNADITRYLGHASYHAVYKLTDNRTFSLKLLNNLRSDNKSSVEFGYSFPMGDTLKGFVQYYNGYGESLIDYNERIQRFGVGIMLNNWL